MTIELSTEMTTEEYAAKAIDLLKEWKAGFSKWNGMLNELDERYASGTITQEFSEQVDAMDDKLDEISYEAAEIMRTRIFDGIEHYQAKDWIWDDYDNLMADLEAIARGDM